MTEREHRYRPTEVEGRVRELWERLDVFRTPEHTEKPFYCLDMFPYPSGEGLHVGHVEGYTATDIYSRYKRMRGYDVLHPMGWDAFGLPAENTAIKKKVHPRTLVAENVARFKKQLQRMGYSYDWSRELNTTDPDYYKWTQWIFLKLFHLGLAYEADVPINWCPSDKTGLANEEVVDGKCERCGTPVEKKNLRQWLLKITKYADRLLHDVDELDWPEGIKELQRNWIGRKEGINISYPVVGSAEEIICFTTRPDTNFGATFIVIAPEHPFARTVAETNADVRRYVEAALSKTDLDRQLEGREKTGVSTGASVVNRLTGGELPVYVSDFVLGNVGTGAVVGVPGHDARDFEFAQAFGLPIVRVVVGPDGDASPITRLEQVQEAAGTMVNSSFLDELDIHVATQKMMDYLEEKKWGTRTITYSLKDWVFSRQRYWGEPIPIVHCASCGVVPVPEEQLPVLLPDVENYEPTGTGESPLAAIESWVQTSCPQCGRSARRETNTMPQWAGSCWYFLRFVEPRNTTAPWSWEEIERWLPVHLYVGGAEHAVLHLLYARFWIKALFDGGYLPIQEPFAVLRNQGLILGPDGQKMSKSRGNVVNPDEIVEQYGADTLRLYEMFLGPLEASKPWNPGAINGVHRFLYRVWGLAKDTERKKEKGSDAVRRTLHRLIKKVTEDIEHLKFNTAIAAMMEFVNLAEKEGIARNDLRTFLLLLSPFAPHLAEFLWQEAKEIPDAESIVLERWPDFDPSLLEESEVVIVVQVNGKVRDELRVSKDMTGDALRVHAEQRDQLKKFLAGKTIRRVVEVPGKLINFVVEG